jgi:hypothetical protein
MLYALHPADRAGAVLQTAATRAKLVGMEWVALQPERAWPS